MSQLSNADDETTGQRCRHQRREATNEDANVVGQQVATDHWRRHYECQNRHTKVAIGYLGRSSAAFAFRVVAAKYVIKARTTLTANTTEVGIALPRIQVRAPFTGRTLSR